MNCKILKCPNPARTAGMCPKHYSREKYGAAPRESDTTEMPKCAVSHCAHPATARAEGAMCGPHYQIKWRGIDPETRKVRPSGQTDRKCWVEECPKRAHTKGLCNYHSRRARTGKLEVPAELGVVLNGPCAYEGCDRPYVTKGLCHSHYSQLQTGRELGELRDYGKYVAGDHICLIPECKKVSIALGLCEGHKGKQAQYKISVEKMVEVWTNPECSNPRCDNTKRLCMDHDHTTGEFRGLLCPGCNSALGFAKEDAERLRGLAEYIEGFQ